MGVYIPNMEMPKNCDGCQIMTYEDTNCISVHELYCGCPIVFRAHPQHEERRPDYCPLIEVPKHGRLIDADALRSLYDNIAYDADGITNEEFDKMTVSVAVIRQNIDDMPTIIEAEDSVKRAKWEKHNDGIMYWWECSRCHVTVEYNEDELTNYCSHCGAKMEIIEAEQQT